MKESNYKALLLAAGFGSRLRPLTYSIPKCLVKIGDYPILEHWLKKIELMKIKEVLINTHYLSDKVNYYLSNRPKSDLKITVVHEDELLGTAGTLIKNQEFFFNSNILFIHADNFTLDNLSEFVKHYEKNKDNDQILLTMLTFQAKDPSKCGIVNLNADGLIDSFEEKVPNPKGNLANGAVYLFNYNLIKFINNSFPNAKDFSVDILPRLIKKMNTWQTSYEYLDIGTYENLFLARKYYLEELSKFG